MATIPSSITSFTTNSGYDINEELVQDFFYYTNAIAVPEEEITDVSINMSFTPYDSEGTSFSEMGTYDVSSPWVSTTNGAGNTAGMFGTFNIYTFNEYNGQNIYLVGLYQDMLSFFSGYDNYNRIAYYTVSGSVVFTTKEDVEYTIDLICNVVGSTIKVRSTPSDDWTVANQYVGKENETFYYQVTATGYQTVNDSHTITGDERITISLDKEAYSIEIVKSPSNLKLWINETTYTADYILANYGDEIDWQANCNGYNSDSGTYTVLNSSPWYITLTPIEYTVTISPIPADATVLVRKSGSSNWTTSNSYTGQSGDNFEYQVSAVGYESVAGGHEIGDSDETKVVELTQLTYTFRVEPTPTDATVKITANGVTTTGKYAVVAHGDSVTYTVSATGYQTHTETLVITSDTTKNVILTKSQYTVTIAPSPSNAIVLIDGTEKKSISGEYGTTFTYNVSCNGYNEVEKTHTITKTETITVAMVQSDMWTFTVQATPSTASIQLFCEEDSDGSAGVGEASYSSRGYKLVSVTVSNEGYETFSLNYGIEEDATEQINLKKYGVFTITTNIGSAATIKIENVERSSLAAADGVSVSYSVDAPGYLEDEQGVETIVGHYVFKGYDETYHFNFTPVGGSTSLQNIRLGSSKIVKIKKGTDNIVAVYLGTTPIYRE